MENESKQETDGAVPPELTQPQLGEVKRRRGRPPKFPRVEGAAPIPQESAAPKKRGRLPKQTVVYDDAAKVSLGKQLVGIHLLIASATGIAELAINEAEGQALAGGIIAVAQEYGLSLTGKTGAALQLFAAAAMIYVPRFVVVQARIKQAKHANRVVSTEDGGTSTH